MKSLSAYKLSMGALACAFLVACNTGEEDVVPQMNKSKATPSAQAPKKADAPAEEEPELVPLKSLSGDKTAEAPAEVAAPAPAKAAPFVSGSVQPQQDGQYVIQVGIKPTKKSAQAIANKLAESNISAYLAEVENPGELEGTYYRVRVGFFSSIADAQTYGKEVIGALNFDWWVDNRSNDHVGNPAGESYYNNSQSYEDTQSYEEPAPEPEPEPEPQPQAQPQPQPQPQPQAQPQPQPQAQPQPQPQAQPQPQPQAQPQPQPQAQPQPQPQAQPQPQPQAQPKPQPQAQPQPQPQPQAQPKPQPQAQPQQQAEEVEVEEVVEEIVEEAPADGDDWE
ncbi:SPOR domain-containing protein [uncultured Fibrobacter sp.]|uniref:SPOR domain-containing protein n=1 Tax=uncultured Fibrobacter sp. TaxID=261512 RepID=UPI0025D1863A|nr:SPOR domain-containing protein [uncultured Fibrobacter sp.]